jgi:Tol biopolymer transport system component
VHNVQANHIVEVSVDSVLGDSWSSLWLSPNKAFVIGNTLNDLWLGELIEDDGQFNLDYVKPLLSEGSLTPYWAPDSAKLAVASYGQFANILRIIDLNTDETIEITFPHTIATVDWSPDSQVLIVSNYGAGTGLPNSVYTVNVEGDGLRQLNDFFFGYMQWSPNGQYLGLSLSDDTSAHNPFGIIKVEVNQ